eukprot:1189321-Prorocentrum_minimum.AAC.1
MRLGCDSGVTRTSGVPARRRCRGPSRPRSVSCRVSRSSPYRAPHSGAPFPATSGRGALTGSSSQRQQHRGNRLVRLLDTSRGSRVRFLKKISSLSLVPTGPTDGNGRARAVRSARPVCVHPA